MRGPHAAKKRGPSVVGQIAIKGIVTKFKQSPFIPAKKYKPYRPDGANALPPSHFFCCQILRFGGKGGAPAFFAPIGFWTLFSPIQSAAFCP